MIEEEDCKKKVLLGMLAAFIDGEGTIGIAHQLLNDKYNYHQQLTIGNTDIRLICWLVDNFGGSFPKPYNTGVNHKDGYKWFLSGYDSYKLIKKIRPYLILKQEQADNAIELYEKVSKWHYNSRKHMPDYKRKLAEDLYQRNKVLNKRGTRNEEEEVDIPVTIKIRKDVLDNWL